MCTKYNTLCVGDSQSSITMATECCHTSTYPSFCMFIVYTIDNRLTAIIVTMPTNLSWRHGLHTDTYRYGLYRTRHLYVIYNVCSSLSLSLSLSLSQKQWDIYTQSAYTARLPCIGEYQSIYEYNEMTQQLDVWRHVAVITCWNYGPPMQWSRPGRRVGPRECATAAQLKPLFGCISKRASRDLSPSLQSIGHLHIGAPVRSENKTLLMQMLVRENTSTAWLGWLYDASRWTTRPPTWHGIHWTPQVNTVVC